METNTGVPVVPARELFHASSAGRGIAARQYAAAFGPEYPAEVDPSSSCTWEVLGEMVKQLRLPPDSLFADLGCGRGGTGLWLARACSARLIGIDASPTAVELAEQRIAEFFPGGVAPDRIRFRTGLFEATGLPDQSLDGAISMDALPFTPDRLAALRELRRVLKPGARAVFTGWRRLPDDPKHADGEPGWPELIADAGLQLVAELERPGETELWRRLYRIWQDQETELRAELGDAATELKLREAARGVPARLGVVFTVAA